jgi:hypothetical protein
VRRGLGGCSQTGGRGPRRGEGSVAGVTYDTGMLIAAERGDRRAWSRHRGLLRLGVAPTLPAPALGEAWRGGARQALLARLVAGCEVEATVEAHAKTAGSILGVAGHDDVVDAIVVEGAVRRGDAIVTADRWDIERLIRASGHDVPVEDA